MSKQNLTGQSLRILEFIRRYPKDNLNVTIISKGLKANYGNILKLINRLEKLKLIKKQRQEDTKRFNVKLCSLKKE